MQIHATTILCVKRGNQVAMAGDGQVSAGQTILKGNAVKVRKLLNGKILTGFAGATADAFTLLEKLEEKLQAFGGNLTRAAVELAKDWRTDKMLRRLEAMLIAADQEKIFLLTGNGDVIEPEEGVVAIGSGGNYALAAARALVKNTHLSAKEVCLESLRIAAEICVYTNGSITLESLEGP
ncbi:MAG TPA: ATP-dependent protease subunit HslV [Turneriella sp.]|nr:ATP-dependent protease subunit HslV [Turneriella sp.]HMY10147.1 ATP-dependent protease subunit HslV [Turneriella sp.]HNA78039.1 ATP-dependent protease subunit HslV [Turneriella sp.]HNE19068.1 ATP-dependent protease subunit HslV [Turneriella sp.]HNJ64481.1 ATP-dependent protease subunit HslV [Turneriella sp.]